MDIALGLLGALFKSDPSVPAFTCTGLGTVSLNQDIRVAVGGLLLKFTSSTPVTMPALTAGTDYALYVCADGSVRADANFSAPTGYSAVTSRQIGGFHYGAGSNAAAQAGGDTTPQINPYSLWDLKFRPACPDPRGMALVANRFWCDIYLMGTDLDAVGSSWMGATIADGSSPPKVPTMFGGNGSTTYGSLTWWQAAEALSSVGKQLLDYTEFAAAAYGTTNAVSRGNDAVTTGYGTTNAGSNNADQKFTSKWGVTQASGVVWIWGRDLITKVDGVDYTAATTFGWKNNAGGRGQIYTEGSEGIAAALFGADWLHGSYAGSSASNWSLAPWSSSSYIGARGRSDHLRHV